MKNVEQMSQVVQQWKESELTQKAYCEKIGVKRTTYANWIARSKVKAGAGFMQQSHRLYQYQKAFKGSILTEYVLRSIFSIF